MATPGIHLSHTHSQTIKIHQNREEREKLITIEFSPINNSGISYMIIRGAPIEIFISSSKKVFFSTSNVGFQALFNLNY